jgi:hypothetical protein
MGSSLVLNVDLRDNLFRNAEASAFRDCLGDGFSSKAPDRVKRLILAAILVAVLPPQLFWPLCIGFNSS